MEAGLISEGDACRFVGLPPSPRGRSMLRSMVQPVLEHVGLNTLRRYRPEDLQAVAEQIAREGIQRARELYA